MGLEEYVRKRDFTKTREPRPGNRAVKGARPIFVVQLHHATRRHYDLRLQVGDVLMSWAVPKGPSFDPDTKRMAVQTEDHPLGYETFHGEIPEGEYGQGHMAVFDRGHWRTAGDVDTQLRKGHLRFELQGRKLKGEWHLVRSGRKQGTQPQWVLFKSKDAYASELEADDLLGDIEAPPAAQLKKSGGGKAAKKGLTELPSPKPAARGARAKAGWAKRAAALTHAKKATLAVEFFEPQLAKLGSTPPPGDDWIHELKWDGYRLVTVQSGKAIGVWSRNAIEWNERVPELLDAVRSLGCSSVALDGELIAGQGTQRDFTRLQKTLSGEDSGDLAYAVFDLLHLDGYDLRRAPLIERKKLLAELLAEPPRHLSLSTHIEGNGHAAFESAGKAGFEGIISKRANAAYHDGRSDDWRKTKREETDEFAVVGWSQGRGRRSNGIGSLLLASPEDDGWRYRGKVGTGLNNDQLLALKKIIGDRGSDEPTVRIEDDTLKEVGRATWFDPLFVVEVYLRGQGSTGILRQPSIKLIREDKNPEDLRDSDRGPTRTKAAKAAKRPLAGAQRTLAVSSPEKVIYADMGYTKADVVAYYEAAMEHVLPGVVDRPLSLIRCPNGTGAKCFFQKHHTPGLVHAGLVPIQEDSGVTRDYLVVRDAAGLLELVQLNALEFHPWGSTAETPDWADRIVFDLDPSPELPFAEVKSAAVLVRKLLADLELESFLRTTGGKGLHVVVPLNPGCDWNLGKRFARGFAAALAGSEPDRFIAKSTLHERKGRIFVDYLRNGRGATAVASYSLRARPTAPVAYPIAWSELSKLESGHQFTMADVPARLKRRRKDPWDGIDRIQQNLAKWSQD